MGVMHDIYNKMVNWRQKIDPIYAPAEMLVCSKCGKKYVSRGKHDIGICRECEAEENAHCIGGPLDGEKAHEK